MRQHSVTGGKNNDVKLDPTNVPGLLNEHNIMNNKEQYWRSSLKFIWFAFFFYTLSLDAVAAINTSSVVTFKEIAEELQKERHERAQKYRTQQSNKYLLRKQKATSFRKKTGSSRQFNNYQSVDQKPFFDIPVTYNQKVQSWIRYYQSTGRPWLKERIERGNKYLPIMKQALHRKGLPQDLAYIALIESGFSAHAVSSADAVGYWQFIEPTAKRYNLKIDWWIDERRDFLKSTHAAADYLGDLYKMFESWYLTAAAYNMGEGRLRRLIARHQTNDFWELSNQNSFPTETKEYIPKLLAALLISKAPKLYGFRNLQPKSPYEFEYMFVPGGTDLHTLSSHLGISKQQLKKLNPDLKMGFIPGFVHSHRIRIPMGFQKQVAQFIKTKM